MAFGHLGALGTGEGKLGFGGKKASANVLWTPLNDSGLIEWWDSTAGVTGSGASIAWAGRKGVLTASTPPGTAPTYPSTINSVNVMSFGTTASLQTAAFNNPGSWTMAAVVQMSGLTGAHQIIGADNGSTNRQAQYLNTNSTALQSIAFNNPITSNFTATTSTMTTAATIVGSQHLASSILATINGTNGTPTSTTGTNAAFSVGLGFAAQNAGAAGSLAGLMGDVIFTATITTSNKQKMEGYLAWKFGLQGSLAASNPYSSAGSLNRPPYVSDP